MAHIGKESRFQTVCRLGFLLSLNQHGFRFLQFRDIIIDADQLNLPIFRLMSGAGHDSQNFKDVCPCAMIFVRSVNGYSHRKEEYTPIEDCAAGANVLMDMLYQLANEEDRASSSPQTIL